MVEKSQQVQGPEQTFQAERSYTVVLPNSVLGIFGERLLVQPGAAAFSDQANGHTPDNHVGLGTKLIDISRTPSMYSRVSFTRQDLKQLSDAILMNNDGVDEEGYEVYVSPEEDRKRIWESYYFIRVVQGFEKEGGQNVEDLIMQHKLLLMHSSVNPVGSELIPEYFEK